ncbi:MAG: FtsX-like permease family protein [Chloroflexota bacterium]
MNIQLTLATRYLWGRRLRTALTTLAIVFGVLVIFGTNMIMPTMLRAFQSNLLSASGQVDVSVSHKAGESFDQALVNRVRSVPGVSVAAGSLSRTVNVPTGFFDRAANVGVLTLSGIDPRLAPQLREYRVQQGRFLRTSDERAAVITTSLAEQLGLRLGGELRLPTTEGVAKLSVVGLLPARAMPGNEEVLVTLSQAQKLLDLDGRLNAIDANLATTDQAQREQIQAEIVRRLGTSYQLGGLTSGSEFLASMQMGEIIFNLLGLMALFMGGFIVFNTFRTVVPERRHDIGMLRTLGASRRTIVGTLLAEGLVQGVVGTAAGIGLGYLLGTGMVAAMRGMMQQFLHLDLGSPVVEPGLIVVSVVLGVGVALVAGLLPALAAGRVSPLEALRPPAPEGEGRARRRGAIAGAVLLLLAVVALFTGNTGAVALGGLFCLAGLVLVAPALVHPIANIFSSLLTWLVARDGTATLAGRNLSRQPGRAAVTASTTMIALAIIVAVLGLTSSMTGGIMDLARRTLGSDYLLMPPALGTWGSNVGARADLAEQLRQTRGVGTVSTLRFASTSLAGVSAKGAAGDQSLSLLGIDPVAFPQISGLNFTQGEPRQAYAQLGRGRALIVNGIAASQTGLKLGDNVAIATPEGTKEYLVVGVASDFINAKVMTGYISQEALQADFRKTEDVLVQLNLTPGANRADVEARLRGVVADYPQFTLVSGQEYIEQMVQQLNATFSLFYVVLIVLALPSLIAILNTLAIGVIERTREIGMLRAIGSTRGQVRLAIVAEALLLAAIGTAFGLLGGLYLGYMMVLGINAMGIFPMTYSFPLAGMIAAVAVGLLFGALAALLPARQAAKLQIVQALRYE